MLAVTAEFVEAVVLLVQAGANKTILNKAGKSALDLSDKNYWGKTSESGFVLKAILNFKPGNAYPPPSPSPSPPLTNQTLQAAAEAKKSYGATPLINATLSKDWDAVDALVAVGYPNLDEKDESGYTTLMRAVQASRESTVKALLAAGAKVDAQNNVSI